MTQSLRFPSVLLATALLAGALVVIPAQADCGGGDGGPHKARMEQRIERLSEELALSDDQAEQVHALFERVREQFPRGPRPALDAQRPSREEMEQRRAERRAKREEVHQFVSTEMAAILTPEQLEKFEALSAERQRRHREHRDHGARRGDGDTL